MNIDGGGNAKRSDRPRGHFNGGRFVLGKSTGSPERPPPRVRVHMSFKEYGMVMVGS